MKIHPIQRLMSEFKIYIKTECGTNWEKDPDEYLQSCSLYFPSPITCTKNLRQREYSLGGWSNFLIGTCFVISFASFLNCVYLNYLPL